jgi:hypothetical protein
MIGYIPLKDPKIRGSFTTGFGTFAERGGPLGEGPFPLGEGFTESFLSAKASRRLATDEGLFAESYGSPSRWMCAER